MMNVWLVLPDGTECSYGIVDDGFQPLVGESLRFHRSDPDGLLVPDECGIEERPWIVLGREWDVRLRPTGKMSEHVVFLTLRLGERPTQEVDPE
jgi:hypothetical protein